MHTRSDTRGLGMVMLLGVFYVFIGLAFARFSNWAKTFEVALTWRWLAWVVSGIAFAAHITYSQLRLATRLRTTAIHASLAAGLGALGLAAAANVHEWTTAPRYRTSMAIALVVWPILIAIPALAAALAVAAVVSRRKSTSRRASG